MRTYARIMCCQNKREVSILKVFSIKRYIRASSWAFKVLFYTGLIAGCYLAFSPVEDTFQAKFNDKFLHVTGFFIMSLSAQLAHPKTHFLILSTGLIAFGLAIECVQAYLPHRSFSWLDWLADIAGVALYFMVFARVLRDKVLLD